MKFCLFIASAALAAVVATQAAAGQCGHKYCWGAVGIGPNGEYGYSYGYPDQDDAIARVYADCRGCGNVHSFYNTCGAIAVAVDGYYGFGWGKTQHVAESNAMQFCRGGGSGCAVRVWACSH